MKQLFRRVGLIVSALAVLLVLTACGSGKALSEQNVVTRAKQTNTITWGVKADTKLFGLMDVKDGRIKGFEIDLAKALTKQMLGSKGKASFVQVTSQTRISLLNNGNIDAIMATMTITPEREKQVDFSRSYFDAGQSLLVKRGSGIKSVKDLNKKGATVLGVVGSTSVQNMAKAAPKAKVLQLSDYAQAMTALKSGQGQALTTDNGILAGMAVENPGYELVGGSFTKEPYGIAINKGQGEFKGDINKALTQVEKSGEYNRLLKKWFGSVAGFNYKEMER